MAPVTAEISDVLVGMGQTALVGSSQRARTVLGSCIGLVLQHDARKLAAVAHIVLPQGAGREGTPGKFADTAVPHMLELLAKEGAHKLGLVAKIAGGSNMLCGSGPIQIGLQNHAAVTKLLRELKIPVVGEHVGGEKGRKITFHGDTGQFVVEIVGETKVIL